MKTIYSLLLLSSFSTFASETPIFYMQMRTGGFTPPQFAFKKECEVYETKVLITQTKISGTTVSEKNITPDSQWDNLISVAMNGELVQEMGPADFGLSVFLAFQNERQVILSSLDDEGNVVTNLSQEAKTLENIISKICE